jgi:hypothetical protein
MTRYAIKEATGDVEELEADIEQISSEHGSPYIVRMNKT